MRTGAVRCLGEVLNVVPDRQHVAKVRYQAAVARIIGFGKLSKSADNVGNDLVAGVLHDVFSDVT